MKTLLCHIAKRWIIGNPVKIKENFEGQGLTESNCYLLGCRAGPENAIENLLHEMAHLSERELPKILKRPFSGWGFTYGKYWSVMGQSGYEPQTEQAVLREARTWAFQLNIQRELGIDISAEELVSSAVYIPAFCNFQWKRVSNYKELGYREAEQEGLNQLKILVENYAQTEYSFSEWERRWYERMDALKKKKLTRRNKSV